MLPSPDTSRRPNLHVPCAHAAMCHPLLPARACHVRRHDGHAGARLLVRRRRGGRRGAWAQQATGGGAARPRQPSLRTPGLPHAHLHPRLSACCTPVVPHHHQRHCGPPPHRNPRPSYNVAFFPKIYNLSGYPAFLDDKKHAGTAFEQPKEWLKYQVGGSRRDSLLLVCGARLHCYCGAFPFLYRVPYVGALPATCHKKCSCAFLVPSPPSPHHLVSAAPASTPALRPPRAPTSSGATRPPPGTYPPSSASCATTTGATTRCPKARHLRRSAAAATSHQRARILGPCSRAATTRRWGLDAAMAGQGMVRA
jgi:hypothetical protein